MATDERAKMNYRDPSEFVAGMLTVVVLLVCGFLGYLIGVPTNKPTSIRASSIEITGPGGQIVIMVDNDKPVLRVIDSKKVGGVDRSVENLFSERAK